MSPQVCPNVGELTDYCLGALSSDRIDAVAEHVDHCTDCAERLTELIRTTDPLADAVRRAGSLDGYEPRTISTPTLLRDYRLEDVLGEGGMGTVYRAMHTRLGRPVALKLLTARRRLDPDASARFEREMRAIGALRHPNIVHATDAGEVDGVPFLVMELLDGQDLGQVVHERGPMQFADACETIRQAAIGLQHAHEHGLVHRDVKPRNLMLSADGTVKLLDLGLARNATFAEVPGAGLETAVVGVSELTDENTRVGTERYMAPEQRTAPEQVGPQADIYALGRTLCYLLHGNPELPANVPAELHSVLQRMQAHNAQERFRTASEVAKALAPWCPQQAIEPDAGESNARMWLGFAVACSLVVGLGVSIAVIRSLRETPSDSSLAGPLPIEARKQSPKIGQLGIAEAEAIALQAQWASYLEMKPIVENAVGMRLAVIPPGELNTSAVTHVRITEPYLYGVTEVTRAQFRDFVTKTGHETFAEKTGRGIYQWYQPTGKLSGGSRQQKDASLMWRKPGYPDPADADPVTQVSWDDANAFCKYLSDIEGKKYRLPTYSEAVWAARAGNSAQFPGGTEGQNDAHALEEYACTGRLSPKKPISVGKLKPNAWGLFDTIGNVSEWTTDWWGELPGGTFENYRGPENGKLRMLAGSSHVIRGSFDLYGAVPPEWSSSTIGFRVVREP